MAHTGIGWGLNETEPKNSSMGGETGCATFSLLLVVGETTFICWWWGDLVNQIYLQLNVGPGINTSVSKDVMATSSKHRNPFYLIPDALNPILPNKSTMSFKDMKILGTLYGGNHEQ